MYFNPSQLLRLIHSPFSSCSPQHLHLTARWVSTLVLQASSIITVIIIMISISTTMERSRGIHRKWDVKYEVQSGVRVAPIRFWCCTLICFLQNVTPSLENRFRVLQVSCQGPKSYSYWSIALGANVIGIAYTPDVQTNGVRNPCVCIRERRRIEQQSRLSQCSPLHLGINDRHLSVEVFLW